MRSTSIPPIVIFAVVSFFHVFTSESRGDEASHLTDLRSLIAAVESARDDLQIPGCVLAVVKDDQVVLLHAFGLRDVEQNLPVTPDTRFAIGSCSKAFTGLLAAMSADAGKLSFDDSPKKFLPWFDLADDRIENDLTLRDMLSHRSGMGGADLLWYTGTLSRDEVIRAFSAAQPTARLREKWQYQNIMYSAAGQAIAAANDATWEELIDQRIFVPLGMTNSDTSAAAMQKASDFSRAYDYDPSSKKSRLVPMRDLTNIAPAGAINSCARDMAQWVRFMLNRGEVDGKRLVSEANFNETITKQFDMSPGTGYAMGWVVAEYDGEKILAHAGGIDGFNAHVTLVPEHQLGYVLLTNVSRSTLDAHVRNAIFEHFLGEPATQPAGDAIAEAGPDVDPKSEVGKYGMIEVIWRDDSLFAVVPGQPQYKLVNVAARKYKLDNAPAGFFITFRESEDGQPEIWLEQPHGNYALAKEQSPEKEAEAAAKYDGPLKELLGTWSTAGFEMRITVRGNKVVSIVPGQPVYTLTPTDRPDAYSIPPAPSPAYEIRVQRDEAGAVKGLLVKQPQGDLELTRSDASADASANIDELLAKIIAAAGGEENLRKHQTLYLKYKVDFENQGIVAQGTSYAQAPDKVRRTTVLSARALDRELGTTHEYFDGSGGGATGTFFSPTPLLNPDEIAAAQLEANFYGPAEWKKLYRTIALTGEQTIEGEPVHVLSLRPESGSAVTVYVSKETHRLVRREQIRAGAGASEPLTETYSDWRDVQGVMLPFRTEQKTPSTGRAIVIVEEAKFGVTIDPDTFRFPGG